MGTGARISVAIPVVAALAWFSAIALRNGSADAIVYGASVEMGTWAASRSAPGHQTWEWVREDLNRAAYRTPDNPTVQELLGVLGARRFDKPEYVKEGAAHFAKAVELRPTSPYSWANIADAKYRLGDTGKQFEAALVRSAYLGPSEAEVQRTVADLGLAVWNEVAPSTRGAIESMVAAGMRRNAPEMLQISGRRGRLDVACRHLASLRTPNSSWSKLCQSTEATS
jgi:predicted Zn-dependent protease